jgi:hypothetical protein
MTKATLKKMFKEIEDLMVLLKTEPRMEYKIDATKFYYWKNRWESELKVRT